MSRTERLLEAILNELRAMRLEMTASTCMGGSPVDLVVPPFESVMLRLKERVGVPSDKGIAELLGMTDKALNARKRRNKFPKDKLFALAAKRPELGLDVTHILIGRPTRASAASPACTAQVAP